MEKRFLNIALRQDEYRLHGCPICGCTTAVTDSCYVSNCIGITCRECETHFFIVHEKAKQENITVSYSVGKDDNDNDIMLTPVIIPHPRKGIYGHEFIYPDIRPEDGIGEYWTSRGIGYDLSGFVKSKQAGERLLGIVKRVLKTDSPKSWLDWREHNPEWIQFKFQKEEFNLEKLEKLAKQNNNILTEEILIKCVI